MKRFLLILCLFILHFTSHAQLQVISMNSNADTLICEVESVTRNLPSEDKSKRIKPEELVNLYKGEKGYLLKNHTTEVFKKGYEIYLGTSIDDAIQSMELLIELCEKDVATITYIKDIEGNEYKVYTAKMSDVIRRKYLQEGDRIHIKKEDIEEWMCLKKVSIETALKTLRK